MFRLYFFIAAVFLMCGFAVVLIQTLIKNDILQRKADTLEAEFKSSREGIARFIVDNNKRASKEVEFKQLQQKYKDLASDNQRLETELASSREEMKGFSDFKKNRGQDTALQKANARLTAQIESNIQKLQSLEGAAASSKKAIDDAKRAAEESEKAAKRSAGEANALKASLERKEKELAAEHDAAKRSEAKWSGETAKLQSELQRGKSEKASMSLSLAKRARENQALNKKLKDALDAAKRSEAKWSKETAKLQAELEKKVAQEKTKIAAHAKLTGNEAASLKREAAVAHYNLGVMHMQSGRHREAASEFGLALAKHPNDAFAHYNLGLLYDKYLDDPEKAMAHYEEYVALLPDASDVKKVQYRLFQVRLQQDAGVGEEVKRR